tara:strand:- start:97 stop:642 length:546 start_codon:yes stop_codon:yes gene_type:complete
MIRHTHLDYDFKKILDAEYNSHSGTCLFHQVHEAKDIHDQYGGFPNTYIKDNTTIHQLWWDNGPILPRLNFTELGKLLEMDVVTVSSIMQEPGNIIPVHRDMFFKINNEYPDDKRTKVRANIFMEDWKFGHILNYLDENTWRNENNWKTGDAIIWDGKVQHLSANAGLENKYTLQVSGFQW